MMADVKKLSALLVIHYLPVALLLCVLTTWTEAEGARVRRQGCQDGTYEHKGSQCCNCPAGTRVEVHCTAQSPDNGKCEPCESGKQYQIHANHQETCDPCTSCAQPNANLEVDTQCTPYRDSTCKCKENHYCPSGKTPCKVCEPCQVCGPEGEKVACSLTNNTICNDKPQDNTLGIALGIFITLLLAVAVAVGLYFFWKKRKSGGKPIENGHVESSEENVPLQTFAEHELPEHLTPHIPDIAEVIGWTIMRNLAMNSEIHEGKIQSCEENYPNNSVERTIALMKIWDEKESKNAASKLIEHLKKTDQNRKVEDVLKILRGRS